MTKRIKKIYDDDFKKNAVNLVLTSGRTVKEISESLGVSENTLYIWKNKFQNETEEGHEFLKKENERLKKENLTLRQEREILKKSVAIFLRPQK
jgi:transposase